MRFGRDVLSGLGLSFWSLLIALAVVPLYIRYLGMEAYGLIGFYITLQAIFQILDLGLSPAVNREVAWASASGRTSELPDLVRSLEVVSLATAALILVIVALSATLIADYWLNVGALSRDVIIRSIILIGVTIACRWPVGLYLGVLMGAHRITLGNNIGIAAATASSLGGVAVIMMVSPTPEGFFVWQVVVGILHVLILRLFAWRLLDRPTRLFSVAPLRRVWRFSLAMTGVALSGVLFAQLDKIILSKMLPLAQFGQYMLATTVAGTLYRIVTPVYNAVYPRFSACAANDRKADLTELYRIATTVLASILFPAAIVLTVFGTGLVTLWTGDAGLAAETAPLIAILAFGSSLHGVMYIPYALQLAYGATSLPLQINLLLMVVQLPLTIVLSIAYGATGGAIAWLVLHILYLFLGSWLTHRRLLPGVGWPWLSRDLGVPLLTSVAVGGAAWLAISATRPMPFTASVAAVFTGMIAVALSAWMSPHPLKSIRTALS